MLYIAAGHGQSDDQKKIRADACNLTSTRTRAGASAATDEAKPCSPVAWCDHEAVLPVPQRGAVCLVQ
jgi:hypothetical protein